MSEQKLCRDCRFVVYKPKIYGEHALCGRFVDYSTGERHGKHLAMSERRDVWPICFVFNSCGKSARHFQPKDNNE